MNISKALRLALCLTVMLALTCAPALAKVVSPGTDFYYLDDADVLSEKLEGEIYFCNQLLEEACGAQIVVVTIDTTGSESIDDYAYTLFNKWGIGDSQKQNGLLILLAIGDDDYYVEPGAGLESKLNAGSIKSYLNEYLEPDFAAKNYEAGVKKIFEAFFGRVATSYGAKVTVKQGVSAYEKFVADNTAADDYGGYEWTGGEGRGTEDSSDGSAMLGVIIVLAIVLIIIIAKRSSRKRAVRRVTTPDDVSTMIVADQMLRQAQRTSRTPHIIPTRVSPGYQPFIFNDSTRNTVSRPTVSRPSGGFSSSIFGGGSSSSRSSGSSSSRSSGSSFRSSGSSHSSFGGFGGGHSGGGGTRGGGAGRGRH